MKFIDEPQVFVLAQTAVNWKGIEKYLSEIGADEYSDELQEIAPEDSTDSELLLEIAGRSCYKSFGAGLNPNVKKTRKGNKTYLGNIIKSKHGSVLEHATVTFAFVGVSRVFTHELVRHRVGTAFSQESLRYVRLEELTAWYPESFGKEVIGQLYDALKKVEKVPRDSYTKDEWVKSRVEFLKETFQATYEQLEQTQQNISNMLYLDYLDSDFHIKKAITSAMRRLAPIGLGTGIIFTTNHRNLRHILEQRTSPAAEEEIRLVFRKIAEIMKRDYRNIYQDMKIGDDGTVTFDASKI